MPLPINRALAVGMFHFLFASVLLAQTTQPVKLSADWTPLFNGKDLTGFSTFIGGQGKDKDPEGYFKVKDGMIHVLDIPISDARKEFGYFATIQSYGDFHLKAQYKWGEKRHAPRQTQPRDSGVLYLMSGTDKVWPDSVECQVQEGDTGEMIIVGNNLVTNVPVKMRGNQRVFSPTGSPISVNRGRIYKEPVPDSKTDWNTVEVIVKGNSAVHIINNVVIMLITDIKTVNPDQPLTSGRIVFQAEGAEVFYKNIEIRGLKPDEHLPKPTPLPAS